MDYRVFDDVYLPRELIYRESEVGQSLVRFSQRSADLPHTMP